MTLACNLLKPLANDVFEALLSVPPQLFVANEWDHVS